MRSIVPGLSDRECLESWARHRDVDGLRTLVKRYLVFVYSSALRRTGDTAQAAEVTRAVFVVLARGARRQRKKTVLAGWLFHVTTVACRKLTRKRFSRPRRFWQWVFHRPGPALPPDATLWTRLSPQIDRALERLRTKQRNAVLLCVFLNHDFASAAEVLRMSERCVEKCVRRGMKNLANRLRKRRAPVDPGALPAGCAIEGCAASVPEGLSLDMLHSMEASRGQRPSLKLAHRTLNTLAWLRWRRRFVIGYLSVNVLIATLGGIAVYIDSRSGYSRLISEGSLWWVRYQGWRVAEVARPWPTNGATPRLDAGSVRNARDLYRTTNIWLAHLSFTREQWKALEFAHRPDAECRSPGRNADDAESPGAAQRCSGCARIRIRLDARGL